MNLLNKVIGALWLAGGICFAAEPGSAEIYTGTVWAEGVSQTSGWYDVDKSPDDTRDDMMCYAASASNLITWWQNGCQLTSSAPTHVDDIWATYLSYSKNHASGGDPLAAINWWISGVYAPANEREAQRSLFNQVENPAMITLNTFGGYYYDQYGLGQDELKKLLDFSIDYTGSDFGRLLGSGAGVSLLLKSDSGGLAHVITLWGAEYTESGSLSKLWVTDSDDASVEMYYDELFSIDVVTGSNGKIYFDAEGETGYYELMAMQGISGVYIDGISSIYAGACSSWQMLPEPTTTTLSLIALVALTTRRRRK